MNDIEPTSYRVRLGPATSELVSRYIGEDGKSPGQVLEDLITGGRLRLVGAADVPVSDRGEEAPQPALEGAGNAQISRELRGVQTQLALLGNLHLERSEAVEEALSLLRMMMALMICLEGSDDAREMMRRVNIALDKITRPMPHDPETEAESIRAANEQLAEIQRAVRAHEGGDGRTRQVIERDSGDRDR